MVGYSVTPGMRSAFPCRPDISTLESSSDSGSVEELAAELSNPVAVHTPGENGRKKAADWAVAEDAA